MIADLRFILQTIWKGAGMKLVLTLFRKQILRRLMLYSISE